MSETKTRPFPGGLERPLAWLAILAAVGLLLVQTVLSHQERRERLVRPDQAEQYAEFMENVWMCYFHSQRRDMILDKSLDSDEAKLQLDQDLSGLLRAYYLLEPGLAPEARDQTLDKILELISFCRKVYDGSDDMSADEAREAFQSQFLEYPEYFRQVFSEQFFD